MTVATLAVAAMVLANPSRFVLPNGAVVAIVPTPVEGRVAVVMSARGTGETADRVGQRHLLEHLVALGPDQDFDDRVERFAGYLRAETSREAIEIGIEGPPLGLETFLKVLAEAASPQTFDAGRISREARIIEEEAAIRLPYADHAAAAWALAFGDDAPDPMGVREELERVTPDALQRLHVATFDPRGLTVVVAGDVDVAEATRLVGTMIGNIPARRDEPEGRFAPRPAGAGLSARTTARGGSRATAIGPLDTQTSMETVAASFALQRALDGSVVSLTESFDQAVVTLWNGSPDWTLLDKDAAALAAPYAEAAIRDLARLFSPTDPFARARLEARLRAPTGVRATPYLAEVALRLERADVARAASRFAEPLALQVLGR